MFLNFTLYNELAMKKYSSILLVFCFYNSMAQTGPGGVGNSTNNRLWFDANTLALSNNALVTTWTDVSGNAKNLTPQASSTRPNYLTSQINGFPALFFNGVDDMRSSSVTAFSNNPNISYIVVCKSDNASQVSSYVTNSYSTNPGFAQSRLHGFYMNGATSNTGYGRTASAPVFGSLTNNTSYNIHSLLLSASSLTTYSNNTVTGSQSATFATPATHNIFQIGRRPFISDQGFTGKMAEIIVFSQTLNTTQLNLINNYLSSKYSLAIANDFYAMEGSGHYFNVTGIGMEGGNAVSNSEGRSGVQINSASDLANGDYLLWGHNNASLTVNTTNVPSQFAPFAGSRLNRTWRIDETGDVGTYTLAINMASMPALGASTSDYVLMIDDDGDFSNGGTTYHSTGYTFIGNIATWTGVDLPDGSYFTVAYVPAIFSITTGAWTDNLTWNCNCQPTNSDNVFVSAGDVVTVDGFAETGNFTIVATGTIDFSGLNELAISGDFDNQGTFDGTNGHLTMNGSTAQLINSNSSITFQEFEVDNSSGVTLVTGTYSINSVGTYFPTEGDLDVSGVSFTFQSDASGSARIDAFTATSSITGNVVFNRFIPAGTGGYRDLSVPLVGGATVTQFDDDMFISGQTGFSDGCASSGNGCFSSFKFFVANAYTDITNASTNIPNATRGVHAWIADGYPAAFGTPVTIDLTGSVNGFGNIVASASSANTFTMIGNPYISQIDFDELSLSNIGDFYYVWDVNINNYNWYQTGNGASPLTEVIASGQGFVVMPETGFGTVTFSQDVKTSNPGVFIRNVANNDFFRITLNNPSNKYACDVTFNVSEQAENKFDKFDIPTPYGLDTEAVYISAKVDERIVRCFGMNNKETTLSVPLMVNVPTVGMYTINAQNLELFNKYSCVILEDLETGSRYDLRNISEVRFFASKVRSEEARFIVHFSNDACSQFVAGLDINTDQSTVEMTNFNEYVKVDMNFAAEENVTISFYNMLGQSVLSEQHQNVSEKSVNVNVPANLKNGVYLVVVETNKNRYTRKYNF